MDCGSHGSQGVYDLNIQLASVGLSADDERLFESGHASNRVVHLNHLLVVSWKFSFKIMKQIKEDNLLYDK